MTISSLRFSLILIILNISFSLAGQASPRDSMRLDELLAQANALSEQGQLEEAKSIFQSAIAFADSIRTTDSETLGDLHIGLGSLHIRTNNLDQAFDNYSIAYRILPKDNGYAFVALAQLSYIYIVRGQYEKAVEGYGAVITFSREQLNQSKNALPSPNRTEAIQVYKTQLLSCLANSAYIYGETGQYQRAITLINEAISLISTANDADSQLLTALRTIKSQLLSQLGQFDLSIDLARKACRNALEADPDGSEIATLQSFHNLAKMFNTQSDSVLHYGYIAKSYYESQGQENHIDYSGLLVTLGAAEGDHRNFDKAEELIFSAIDRINQIVGENTSRHSAAILALADIYLKQYKYEQIIEILENTLPKINHGVENNLQFVGNIYPNLAIAYEQTGQTERSIWAYENLRKALHQKLEQEIRFLNQEQQLDFATLLRGHSNRIQSFALRHKDEATAVEMAYWVHLQLQEIVLGNRQHLLKMLREEANPQTLETLNEWLAIKRQLGQYYSQQEQAVSVDSLEQYSQQAEHQLLVSSEHFASSIQLTDWQAVQQNLKEGEAVLDFSHFNLYNNQGFHDNEQQYVAYLFTKAATHPKIIPLFKNTDLPNLNASRSLYSFAPNASQSNLHQLIGQAVAAELQGIHRLYFSTSGLLHRVNIGAIPFSAEETFAEHFQLLQIGNPRQLIQAFNLQDEENLTAVIFGGLEYDQSQLSPDISPSTLPSTDTNLRQSYRGLRDKSWPYLEWSAKEATAIDSILQSTGYAVNHLSGQAGTESAFKLFGQETPSPRLIHMATHGYFFPDPSSLNEEIELSGFEAAKHPLIRSGLILSGSNSAWLGAVVTEGQEDGILTAFEIAQMDLSNTDLVVLSACETGLGDILGSEGVIGLQRAFRQAGVKYVMMSLWSVQDKKTYEFMTLFYDHWQSGQSIPAAYRFAQSSMRERYALPFNPRNWAGFILLQ